MSFLRRIDLVAEIAYKSRKNFLRIKNSSRAMTPRLPPHSTVTIKTDVDRFYVGDIIAFRNPVNRFDSTPLLREVIAGPGSLIEGEGGDSSFTLEDNQYWVASRQPDEVDSQTFGPINADDHIMGRAVHCSTMRHWINNSVTARTEDADSNWVVPLAPQTMADLSKLWSKTNDEQFLDLALPDDHRARSEVMQPEPRQSEPNLHLA